MTNGVNNYRWAGPTDSAWAYDNTGVSLGLSHGVASEVVITNFDAPNYHQGWICAATKIQLNNVNLGTGFANDHEFKIDPYCGDVTSVVGTSLALTRFSRTLQFLLWKCIEHSQEPVTELP